MGLIVFIVVIVAIWGGVNARSKKKRREELLAKYADLEVVEKIMQRTVWQGETQEQLRDSLGQPVSIDERVLKSKKRETWKYHKRGHNRFGLRIVVENGLVVGWDQKD